MALYARVEDGAIAEYPFDARTFFAGLRKSGTAVREVADIPPECLAQWSVVPVEGVPRPTVDHTQDVAEAVPVLDQGIWQQTWTVSPADPAVIAARVQARRERVNAGVARRIIASDWTQLSDGPANAAAWATWRAAVRALWNAADPFAIAWPTPPAVGRPEFLARLGFLTETED